MKKSGNHILSAMKAHNLIYFIVGALVLFGIFGLTKMNKDEFPQFTIRQGVVAAVYPGASAQEVEEQVTKPLERFLFTYPEVVKESTYSVTENGIVYVYVDLLPTVKDKDEIWSKIRHGLQLFKKTSLPAGVLEVVVVDDFGNTSSMLLAIESDERTPRELESYAETVCDHLRTIPQMGNLKVLGTQHEEVALLVDQQKLAAYGISQSALFAELAVQGMRTIGGSVSNEAGDAPIHIAIPYQTEYEIGEQIVYTDPSGDVVRLKDIAQIKRRYKQPDNYVKYNGKQTVIVSMEMTPGNDIVAFGKDVEKQLSAVQKSLPPDVKMHKITNQPYVVNKSVMSFLRDLVFSILVVIAVMLLLFPIRTALVASSSVPICTAITMGLMYICGIELNTVTLAALIVVLGMIVDDSVIVVDGYVDMLQGGRSRWGSAVNSTKILFVPMSLATLAISGMFFPMTRIIKGPLGDFVQLFPWTVLFALVCSIFYAVWIIPYLATVFIRNSKRDVVANKFEKVQNKFFNGLQVGYEKLLEHCFRRPFAVILIAIGAIGLGGFLFTHLNIQMLPKADRNCFAVEMHLANGSTLDQTAAVADSVENILRTDERVTGVTSFIGCSSPRFHATYAPQMAHKNYAQLIVNTVSEEASIELLKEYGPKYENHFPNAYVRFKQMDYQAVKNPVEVRISGNDFAEMKKVADSLKLFMNSLPELTWVHSDMDETSQNIKVELKSDEATRLGVTQSMLSLYLSAALGGQNLTNIWEDDYKVPVMLYTQKGDSSMTYQDIEDYQVPTSIPGVWVPLRQVATVSPEWQDAVFNRRNSIRTLTVGADLKFGLSQPGVQKKIDKYVKTQLEPNLPEGVNITYGGLTSANGSVIPQIALSFIAAVLVLFAFLLYHFGKLDIVFLTLSASLICVFGACLGLWIFGLDFSITAVLGVVSLIGIIVRNAIIMFEYAESLRNEKRWSAKDAAFEAGRRRMRPIFLTSFTTAFGVIPMIIAHTGLWMPMGVVICFGTLFSMPLVVTVLPVAYWKIFAKSRKRLV